MTLTVAHSPSFSTTDIAMFPAVSECTITQAATLLGVREGYIEELLDDDLVKHRLENGKRLVDQNSLSDYWQDRKRRHAWLDEMVLMNQEMGLYDD